MAIRAVFFDVGETLVDETRDWAEWADFLGVSRLTFFAALGATIERGQSHREVFHLFDKGFHYERALAGRGPFIVSAGDLYPDARACISVLKENGIFVGVVGNQPESAENGLKAALPDVDLVASSERWGLKKPQSEFFNTIVSSTPGFAPEQIAYVGDRLDLDIYPALKKGLCAIHILRGPWAAIQGPDKEVSALHSLDELPSLVSRL